MNILLRILTVFGVLLLSPLIIISCLLVLLEDGLPILFIQERIGKNEELFKLYKIRTMYRETPSLGTHEISTNNYLNFGKFLRKYKIDELPQLINFILGDLNLVGPRPGLINQKDLSHFRRSRNIFKLKPGITGFSQVLGYDMSNPELLSKIDSIYLENQSLLLDVEIFFATFIKVLRVRLTNKFIKDISNV